MRGDSNSCWPIGPPPIFRKEQDMLGVLSQRHLNVSVNGLAVQATVVETKRGCKINDLERLGSPLGFRAFPDDPASFPQIFRTFRPTLDDTADFIADQIAQGRFVPGECQASGHAFKQYEYFYE